MTTASTSRRTRRWPRVVVILLIGMAAVCGLAVWRLGPGLLPWRTARGFMEAVRTGDCAATARYYAAPPPESGCPPSLYGLPDDLTGYRLTWGGIYLGTTDAVKDDQGGVGLTVPGDQTAYGLHMVRRGHGWVIDSIDPST